MSKKNIKIDNFLISQLPILSHTQNGLSIIHYSNHLNQKCVFIGLNPTQIVQCNTNQESDNISPTIQDSLQNDDCVWVAATSYEWGCNQLERLNFPNPTALFIQYHHGFWVNLDTNITTPFGTPTLNLTQPTIIPKNPSISLSPKWSKDDFSKAIKAAQSAIKEGDIYQINLSYPSEVESSHPLTDLYHIITSHHTPPYSAFVSTPDCTIASFSPEEFFTLHNGTLRTRPIKGTIGRHSDPDKDQLAYDTLKHSSKDHAELIMITDLLRNDLSQCAVTGTVTVEELCKIHSFDYVYHLVSTITAKLQPSLSPFDAFKRLAPGGSITGCPKYSACHHIHSIEDTPRQFYTGHIGFMTSSGNAVFNVAIRTCYQLNNGPILTHSGCGITIDSAPDQEYQESLDKLRFITDYVTTSEPRTAATTSKS